ncbi:MAG: histidine kinase, partial [Bacteroidota bacterium]
ERLNFPMGIAFSQGTLANVLTVQDTISEDEAKLALQMSLETKTFFGERPQSLLYLAALLNEGYSRLALGEISATKMLLEEIETHPGLKNLRRQAVVLRLRLAYAQNIYPDIVTNLEELKKLDDQHAYNVQKGRITQLQTLYETEKKEAKIQELALKSEVQELEIQTKNQWLLIGLISFGLIVILGVAVYFRMIQRQQRQKLETLEIEQRFLRAQLNPHFIFNALDSIQNYMLENDMMQASTYLGRFARLMRQVLENSREAFIPLEQEIEMLQNYMEVHRLEANKTFEFKLEIEPALDPEETKIPPMFVQPFIENAIKHGLIDEGGKIEVRFTKASKQYVMIEVLDDGVGIENKLSDSSHKSLATSIIMERIENYNKRLKTNISLSVDNRKEGVGTQVALKVPFI